MAYVGHDYEGLKAAVRHDEAQDKSNIIELIHHDANIIQVAQITICDCEKEVGR